MYGIIYETTNLINGMKYIGRHKLYDGCVDDGYLGSGKLLLYAIDKYGVENFTRKTLCECHSEEDLNNKEIYYIRLYNAVNSDNYYNLNYDSQPPENDWTFGDSIKGKIKIHLEGTHKYVKESELSTYLDLGWCIGWDPSSRKKMSASRKKLLSNPKNHPMYGKKHTEEIRKKISDNLPDRSGENNPMYSKKHTEEYKENKSIQYTGRVWVRNLNINLQSQIDPKDLDTYIKLGYELGRLPMSESSKDSIREAMKKVVYIKICNLCNKEFESKGSRTSTCPICKEERGWL